MLPLAIKSNGVGYNYFIQSLYTHFYQYTKVAMRLMLLAWCVFMLYDNCNLLDKRHRNGIILQFLDVCYNDVGRFNPLELITRRNLYNQLLDQFKSYEHEANAILISYVMNNNNGRYSLFLYHSEICVFENWNVYYNLNAIGSLITELLMLQNNLYCYIGRIYPPMMHPPEWKDSFISQ